MRLGTQSRWVVVHLVVCARRRVPARLSRWVLCQGVRLWVGSCWAMEIGLDRWTPVTWKRTAKGSRGRVHNSHWQTQRRRSQRLQLQQQRCANDNQRRPRPRHRLQWQYYQLEGSLHS